MNTPSSALTGKNTSRPQGFRDKQKLAKERAYLKRIYKQKIKIDELARFTEQFAAMLNAGLPMVTALEALKEQTSNPVFSLIIREVRNDVSSGTNFSDAVRKFPKAFPNFFVSMAEAGEASGAMPDLMRKVANYYEDMSNLMKKVKSALTYPTAVILLAIVLVNVLLLFVIPVFAEMFSSFGTSLPLPTQILLTLSNFLNSNIIYIGIALFIAWGLWAKYIGTKSGRVLKDKIMRRIPIVGELVRKVAVSRFSRTFATLMKSGVPILRTLEICSSASSNTYIEDASMNMLRHVTQGGQISEVVSRTPYFPSVVTHMAKAGEKTGEIESMMLKVSDFFDAEIDKTVSQLTSLIEPFLVVTLGVVIGGIVMAMFLPIFEMSSVMGQ